MRESGYQLDNEIAINTWLRDWPTLWRWTLLHEMVHLFLPDHADHGEKFQKEMLRLARAGAFRNLW
jgi:Zn-dependent peptidase ImmA (M78 family)